MTEDVRDIVAFYGSDPEREAARLEEHRLERDLTWRYLDQHLPADGSVLELGAGTGVYSALLAKRGLRVTAVDFSPELIAQARQSVTAQGVQDRVEFIVADARNLASITQTGFDAVLIMGPLYHLVDGRDRLSVLNEALQRLRSGGLIFSAFLSRLGVLSDLIKRSPGWIDDRSSVRSHMGRGYRPDEAPRGGFRGYFAQVSEIAPLHESVGCETIALAGVEPVIAADDESFNGLSGEHREAWLDLLHEVSTEPSILAASRHILYIGRKP